MHTAHNTHTHTHDQPAASLSQCVRVCPEQVACDGGDDEGDLEGFGSTAALSFKYLSVYFFHLRVYSSFHSNNHHQA